MTPGFLQRIKTREVAAASLLGALSALWEIIPGPPFDIPFPIFPPPTRLSLDLTGIPMMISLLLYGPVAGVYTSLIGCSIIFFRGNIPGGVFKLIAELSTLLGFMLLKKNLVLKSLLAVITRVAVMTITSYYLMQVFYQASSSWAASLLIPLAIFNVIQTLINILPSYFIYSRIRKIPETRV